MQPQAPKTATYQPPAGIIAAPLSDFANGKIMVGCDCCGRSIIPVRGLLKKYKGRSLGDLIDTFRCERCGRPPASASLLSQTHLI